MKRKFSVIPGRLLLSVKAPPSGGKELKKKSDKIRFLKTVSQMYRKGTLLEQDKDSFEWPFGDDVTSASYKIPQDEEEKGYNIAWFIYNRINARLVIDPIFILVSSWLYRQVFR